MEPCCTCGDCPAVEVQLPFSHLLPAMTVSGISCCTGRRWGTLGAGEPGGEFASWTLVPALLFTVSCSSDLSWQPQQAAVCSSRAPAKARTSPCQRLCLSRGTRNPLCVLLHFQGHQPGWEVRESCLTLMTSCNSSFLERNENLPNNKSNKKGHKKPGLIILFFFKSQ